MADVPAVEFRNVTKCYTADATAVDRLDLRIPAGKVVALLGPSGCGKTTTLRLINRLEDATAGAVFVRGKDARSIPAESLRRSIGYVIQEGGLLPHLTVSANVATVPRLLGWPRRRIGPRVAEVLALVGLPEAEFGTRMPAQLSGGQRQRVGVARALAADPDLLLMDEPFGALDPGTREAIQDEFLQLQGRLHKTIVLVTHDVAEAGRLADEIVLLDRGRVLQRGSLRDLLIRPASDRVREFLGRRRQELVLGVIRLQQILDEIPPVPVVGNAILLSGGLPLGQVLTRLTDSAEGEQITADANRAYSARAVLDRVLADLRAATGSSEEVQVT